MPSAQAPLDPFEEILKSDKDLERRLMRDEPGAWDEMYSRLREIHQKQYRIPSDPPPTKVPAGTQTKVQKMIARVRAGLRPTAGRVGKPNADACDIPPDIEIVTEDRTEHHVQIGVRRRKR